MLRLADDMVRDGKSQKDACKSLGISVMTLHRWKKHAPSLAPLLNERQDLVNTQDPPRDAPHHGQVEALRLENQRLRRIVSDLLLEKVKVQEALDKMRE